MRDLLTGAFHGALAALLVVTMLCGAAYWYCLHMPGRSHAGALAPLTAEEADLAVRLRLHVEAIAGGPRNIRHFAALQASAAYIEGVLTARGLRVVSQPYEVRDREVRNLEAVIAPEPGGEAEPALVIGAHYDSAGEAPGANDNATGVAAVLELARLLKGLRPARPVHLVLFVNEEPPFFRTPDMGSARYVEALLARGQRVAAMLSLETIGAYSDAPGSQRYPRPFGAVLGDRADFVAFVGMPGSRDLVQRAVGSFRRHAAFPSLGGVAPGGITGLDWSDHAPFASAGIPAIMVTDTAIFRYAHYHQPTDTPDKVDFGRLARVVTGLEGTIRDLAR